MTGAALISPAFKTKAETLEMLSERVPQSNVPKLLHFSVAEWDSDALSILSQVQSLFKSPVVVRSSARGEDSVESSKAGYYTSLLNIDPNNIEALKRAIEEVIESYQRDGNHSINDRILVQHQVLDVLASGVIFNRTAKYNSLYYVINYSSRGDTDAVTSGKEAALRVVAHTCIDEQPEPWRALLSAVREVENFWPGRPLDLEFAITKAGVCHILQVRPLVVSANVEEVSRHVFERQISDLKKRFSRSQITAPHLYGERTIYSDMADWNPSEIIGDRPNTLAYSLYRYLITDEIWHLARTELGYYDASPGELMVSSGRKPYIDVRLSFNSLTPSSLSGKLRHKLLGYYLDKLEANQELHDKVEHDILFTCYEFGLDRRFDELREYGFSEAELDELKESLHDLTNQIILSSDKIFNDAIAKCRTLNERRRRLESQLPEEPEPWDYITTAYILLSDCRYYGTLPFSVVARMAFIAKQLLLDLDQQLGEGFYDDFLTSLYTVASRFREDCQSYSSGSLDREVFLDRYGHLRPSSYDITAPRYDELPDLIGTKSKEIASSNRSFTVSSNFAAKIDELLYEHSLGGDHDGLLTFMARSMRYRESLKFEFTRNLSDALKYLSKAGEALDLSREQISFLKLSDFWRLRNPEHSDKSIVRERLLKVIERNAQAQESYSHLMLPPVIASESDFMHFEVRAAKPNFIGDRCIEGEAIVLESSDEDSARKIQDKIVMIENADPGFDWIFSHRILGLITKYGGLTSHMAIRCSELNMPGAIGCGEVIFEKVRMSGAVRLDCSSEYLEALGV